MADGNKKSNDDDDILKEIEDSLFKEFNEQVRLTEPTDARLQDSVDLNPNIVIKDDEPKESPANESKEQAVSKEQVQASTEVSKPSDEVDEKQKPPTDLSNISLGDAFSNVVEKDIAKENSQVTLEQPHEEVTKARQILKLLKTVLTALHHTLKKLFSVILYPFKWLAQLNARQRLYLVLIICTAVVLSFFSWRFYDKLQNPQNKSPYLLSFSSVAKQSFSFATDEKREVFFSPVYTPDYAFVIPKVIVNVKRSQNSGTNPMVFVEMILKASNQETAIEFKDRQVEIQDIASRVLEDYQFDSLRSQEGKNALRKDIIRAVNPILNHGIAIDVLYKTFIVKP